MIETELTGADGFLEFVIETGDCHAKHLDLEPRRIDRSGFAACGP